MLRRIVVTALTMMLMASQGVSPATARLAGVTVTTALILEGSSTQTRARDGSCEATDLFGKPELRIGDAAFALRKGHPVDTKVSRTGRAGCEFTLTAKITNAASYTVAIGDTTFGTITAAELSRLDNRIEMAVASEGANRAAGWRFPAKPTPAPKPTKTPSPTAVPALKLGAIPGADTYRMGGTFVLIGINGDDFISSRGLCFGQGGYGDIGVGTQVVVKDETGSIVAVSEFEPDPSARSNECRFVFYLEVPEAKFYVISITHRGEMVYSRSEMEERGWLVQLSLG